MPEAQYITLGEWFVNVWQKQGKTIDELAVAAGFSMKLLQEHLDRRVSTLGDWWELMGKYLYVTYAKFTDALNEYIPANLLKIKRDSIYDWISGRRFPEAAEDRLALYALTVLPCFKVEGKVVTRVMPAKDLRTASDLEILFHLRLLDDAIEKVLYELGELTAMRLIGVSRERFEKMVLTVAKTLANAAEEIEAVHRLEKAVKG